MPIQLYINAKIEIQIKANQRKIISADYIKSKPGLEPIGI